MTINRTCTTIYLADSAGMNKRVNEYERSKEGKKENTSGIKLDWTKPLSCFFCPGLMYFPYVFQVVCKSRNENKGDYEE